MKKNNESIWFQTFIPSLTLFTSFGTLVCCALPALMVTLGMGTTLAGFIGMFPSITFISDYKESIFIISAATKAPYIAKIVPLESRNTKSRFLFVLFICSMFKWVTVPHIG